ncbi:MAG TPA: tetratricopeptide repeat protein [Thermoanaerobaculia bacterium]|nr:tetratricopeptide repeat protein [Thermoanaerobaculia bacterium]
MKRTILFLVTLAAFGCAFRKPQTSEYEGPFYAKYLNTGSALDAQINRTLEGLRLDPNNSQLHNDLGALLVQKRFPNDAEREFERAVDLDKHNYQAWYNLGLVRASRGDEGGARRAYMATVHYKPGHALALFQLGLVEEKLQHTDRAVNLIAKALTINPRLIDPGVNPRILDTQLLHLALIKMYPDAHERASMQFQGVTGAGTRRVTAPPQAPSPQPTAQQIIPPSPPATDPSQQKPPV